MSHALLSFSFFFFNDTATTEIYTLSLHDALPISPGTMIGIDLDADDASTLVFNVQNNPKIWARNGPAMNAFGDRKSTRLNSSHLVISYAVFCLKKKKKPP